jgi:hypothetical protein
MSRNKDLFTTKGNSPMEKAGKLMELETQKKAIVAQIESIKADLLEVTQNLGVLSLKTEKYTISRARRVTPTVLDFDTLKSALEAENIPIVTEVVFGKPMSLVFKKFADEGREFEGLEFKQTEYITVRVKEEETV